MRITSKRSFRLSSLSFSPLAYIPIVEIDQIPMRYHYSGSSRPTHRCTNQLPKKLLVYITPVAGFGGPSSSPAFCYALRILCSRAFPTMESHNKSSEHFFVAPLLFCGREKFDWIEVMDWSRLYSQLPYKGSQRTYRRGVTHHGLLCAGQSILMESSAIGHSHIRGDKLPALSFAGKANFAGCDHGLLWKALLHDSKRR